MRTVSHPERVSRLQSHIYTESYQSDWRFLIATFSYRFSFWASILTFKLELSQDSFSILDICDCVFVIHCRRTRLVTIRAIILFSVCVDTLSSDVMNYLWKPIFYIMYLSYTSSIALTLSSSSQSIKLNLPCFNNQPNQIFSFDSSL